MDSQKSPNLHPRGLRFQQAVGKCRDLVLVELSALLVQMYDHTESALLDFADKAESNAIRTLFHEAIHKVRDRRPAVEKAFQKELSRGFADYAARRPIAHKAGGAGPGKAEEWTLVDKTEFEDDVAIQKIAYKTRNLYYKQIYAYSQRMALVQGGKRIEDKNLPASPIHILNAFKTAVGEIEIESRTRLILYALFDKYVMRSLGGVYDGCNTLLIDAGVFPNLKPVVIKNPGPAPAPEPKTRRREEPAAGAGGQAPSPQSPEALGAELFDSINSLLTSRRQRDPEYAACASSPGTASVEMATKADLVRQIKEIQPAAGAPVPVPAPAASPAGEAADLQVDRDFIEDLRKTLAEERNKLFQGVDRRRIPTADMNTIELVGMLFEQVLDDPVLPASAKALICRLHTPCLKAAVIDYRILSTADHPVRLLLNLMVNAGCQWVDESDLEQGIYPQLREVVDGVLANFKEDLGIFEELLGELRGQVLKLEQKTRIIEKRTQETVRGRDRFESAKNRVTRIINERMAGREPLPAAVRGFLEHAWADKLILMTLRSPDAEASQDWSEALGVIDDMLDMAAADPAERSTLQFRERLGSLRSSVEEGLSSLGDYHHADIGALFRVLSGERPGAGPQPAGEAPAGAAGPVEIPVEDSRSLELTADEFAMMEKLKTISYGTWFEFRVGGHRSLRRVKLSWYSPATGKYMFVDQSGVQAVMMSGRSLARDLCSGNARILGRSRIPFVDRALEAIRAKLEHTLGGSGATPEAAKIKTHPDSEHIRHAEQKKNPQKIPR